MLNFNTCEFVTSAVSVETLPISDLPEMAFIGRSNVGKSSLINALTNRKNLAKTSNTPGRTRQLNFFRVPEKLMIVDLPGYGYAKVSKKEVKAWTRLIKDYLRGRRPLRRVFLLVDSRHGLKPSDLEFMELMADSAVSNQIVLTKIDKIKAGELEGVIKKVGEAIKGRAASASLPDIISTSSVKRVGMEELVEIIEVLSGV